jgi:hypothetical protein
MRKFLPALIIVIIAGLAVGYYLYNKPHREADDVAPDYTMTPAELLSAYEQDEATADATYLDKVISLQGTVLTVNDLEQGSSISLDAGNVMASVICEFESKDAVKGVQVGQKVNVKGFCSGKLMDVVLVRCILGH